MWGHMSTTDLPGSSLLAGRYRLVERLGAGGMSVVWRGFDEVLGRQVAVKVLPPSTSTDPSFRRRLRAEAQAAARLSHPHITNVYDYGEATTVDGEPVPYVVMELVDGESLAAVLARVAPAAVAGRRPDQPPRSPPRWPPRTPGASCTATSPRPTSCSRSSGAKVVDFGISALIGENDIDPDGSLLGTPAYLAPERLEGGQVSPATDVYAVGLLIYRTLIGQLPWDVGTTTALLRAHQYTEPEPLPPVEGLPAAVAALVARCLEKRPADRPSSAELAHVLAGVVGRRAGARRGYVPDWAGHGEDTTILPSPRPGHRRLRPGPPGPAQVADPAQAGRGVAAVPRRPRPAAPVRRAGRGSGRAGPGRGPRRPSAPVSIAAAAAGVVAPRPGATPSPRQPVGSWSRNSRFGVAARPARPPGAAAAPAGPDGAAGLRQPPPPARSAPRAVRRRRAADRNGRATRRPAGSSPAAAAAPPDAAASLVGRGRRSRLLTVATVRLGCLRDEPAGRPTNTAAAADRR